MKRKRLPSSMSYAVSGVVVSLVLATSAGAASKEKALYAFPPPGGRQASVPNAAPAFDTAGNLYGTTTGGGGTGCGGLGCGTVFKLTPKSGNGWTESVLYRFRGGNDARNPNAGVILDASGNLYGTTEGGGSQQCGTVFELSPISGGAWKESVLYSFTGGQDGFSAVAGVTFDTAGNLFGTTLYGGGGPCSFGGGKGCGVVFELMPNRNGSWTEQILYRFKGSRDGYFPVAGVVLDATGNLYGTTIAGGELGQCQIQGLTGCGVVFELKHGAKGQWSYRGIYAFKNYSDGSNPEEGGVIFDPDGNLYGTTLNGGAIGSGTLFKLTPGEHGAWSHRILHNFTGSTGTAPRAAPVLDKAGNFYGTTWLGGAHQFGVVYKLARNSKGRWTESVLHSFTGGNDGGYPYSSGVVLDSAGNLYGATYNGGAHGGGVVYEVTP